MGLRPAPAVKCHVGGGADPDPPRTMSPDPFPAPQGQELQAQNIMLDSVEQKMDHMEGRHAPFRLTPFMIHSNSVFSLSRNTKPKCFDFFFLSPLCVSRFPYPDCRSQRFRFSSVMCFSGIQMHLLNMNEICSHCLMNCFFIVFPKQTLTFPAFRSCIILLNWLHRSVIFLMHGAFFWIFSPS